jgi:hypothetical protein
MIPALVSVSPHCGGSPIRRHLSSGTRANATRGFWMRPQGNIVSSSAREQRATSKGVRSCPVRDPLVPQVEFVGTSGRGRFACRSVVK